MKQLIIDSSRIERIGYDNTLNFFRIFRIKSNYRLEGFYSDVLFQFLPVFLTQSPWEFEVYKKIKEMIGSPNLAVLYLQHYSPTFDIASIILKNKNIKYVNCTEKQFLEIKCE